MKWQHLPTGAFEALPPTFSGKRMSETINYLTQTELGGRGLGTGGLDRAAQYIAERFREAGLVPAGDEKDSYFQTWDEDIDGLGRTIKMKNVIGVISGKKTGIGRPKRCNRGPLRPPWSWMA